MATNHVSVVVTTIVKVQEVPFSKLLNDYYKDQEHKIKPKKLVRIPAYANTQQ